MTTADRLHAIGLIAPGDPVDIVVEESCDVCGCTDNDACVNELGEACYFVQPGLCSACAGRTFPVYA